MHDALHPKLDDSLLLGPADHSKCGSLIGCANWIITSGRFDIAYAVNLLSRFSQALSNGHLDAMKRVFGYLKKFNEGAIIIDPKYPDHQQFNIEKCDQWKEFYPDAEEDVPPPSMIPEPEGKKIRITAYKDADHAHDLVTRRSVTSVLLFLNNTPVKWISQHQKTVETSTCGSELVSARVATELILEHGNTLRMMGVEPDGPGLMLGDNNGAVLNCTMANSVLKKKHAVCNYHCVCEAITSGAVAFAHIPSTSNFADVLTKPLSGSAHMNLVKPLLFRTPKME